MSRSEIWKEEIQRPETLFRRPLTRLEAMETLLPKKMVMMIKMMERTVEIMIKMMVVTMEMIMVTILERSLARLRT